MDIRSTLLNPLVAASLALGVLGGVPAAAQDVTELLKRLADPELERWQRVERQIVSEWSKSGSAAMDLLLRRGREALADGDQAAAIEHLTALVDHAPDFAEGWYARSTAYFESDRFGPAMHDLRRALALNPEHFGALAGLGTILEETGAHERALDAYRAAHAIHPHQPVIGRAIERMERRVFGFDV